VAQSSRNSPWTPACGRSIASIRAGSGYSALLLFGERLRGVDYLGVDISAAVDVAREHRVDRR